MANLVKANRKSAVPEVSAPKISQEKKDEIIRLVISGEHPSDAEIARRVGGLYPSEVTAIINADPELVLRRSESEREVAQNIENAAITLAVGGRNEIARQKAQEFLLKKMMPDKYGDDARTSGQGGQKRVVINFNLPEVKVNQDGIPIGETIDV